jgi:septum site-determining protein MinD
MVRIIGVSSGKGGVGKTVTASNLGVLLSSFYNKKVVVIDCNLTNPHLGLSLGTMSVWPVTLNNVLKNEAKIDQAMYTHSSGLKILPASFESRDLSRTNMYKIRSRLKRLFDKYDADIVILDSSPGLTAESLFTLKCSDEVIFVATPHIPSIVDITKCCQLLKRMDTRPLGIVLNRVRGRKYEMGDDEIIKFTSLPIIAKIPEDENVLKATNFKSPVVSAYPQSSASRAFMRLGASLLGEELQLPGEGGFFSRLFGRFRS